jgi:hypothetical protein
MKQIELEDYFRPRDYQKPMINAFEDGYKRIISCQARRSGKDVTALSIMRDAALERVGIYWYIWPNAEQGRKHAWNGKLLNGKPFFSIIPDEAIIDKNIAEMRVTFRNSSTLQIVGSEKIDSLMGGNPCGIILTEYALADNQEAFELLLPMLRANDGWCIILSTPRGRNSFYRLYQIAKENPDTWFSQTLTVEDTKHISIADIEHDINTGVMSWAKAQQEYWCNWDMGLDSTVYGSCMDRMRVENRITTLTYMGEYPVMTSWDIGRDMTSIVMFQVVNQQIHIIDYYEKQNENLEYFVKKLQEYPYVFKKHFLPHDGRVIEWAGPKFSRIFKAQRLGLDVDVVERPLFIEDGIETARSKFPMVWIDEKKCERLIACLENYSYKRDEKKDVNSSKPIHDWSSHGSSAFMYMTMALDKLQDGMTEQETERIRKSAFTKDDSYSVFDEKGPYRQTRSY